MGGVALGAAHIQQPSIAEMNQRAIDSVPSRATTQASDAFLQNMRNPLAGNRLEHNSHSGWTNLDAARGMTMDDAVQKSLRDIESAANGEVTTAKNGEIEGSDASVIADAENVPTPDQSPITIDSSDPAAEVLARGDIKGDNYNERLEEEHFEKVPDGVVSQEELDEHSKLPLEGNLQEMGYVEQVLKATDGYPDDDKRGVRVSKFTKGNEVVYKVFVSAGFLHRTKGNTVAITIDPKEFDPNYTDGDPSNNSIRLPKYYVDQELLVKTPQGKDRASLYITQPGSKLKGRNVFEVRDGALYPPFEKTADIRIEKLHPNGMILQNAVTFKK